MMAKINKEDQKLLAKWAADCAERFLALFEKSYPNDDRPRKAIEKCREWIRTGEFHMNEKRGASLDAHKAAKDVKGNNAACFAAHAAGQAVATAHVSQHAFGAAYYTLKIAALDGNIAKELAWQSKHLPKHLKKEWAGCFSKRLPKKLKLEWEKFLIKKKNKKIDA
jgi:hypothetical protein